MRILGRYMKPIPADISKMWHNRLTFAYIFISFNAMLYTIYIVKKRNPELKRLQPGDRGTASHSFCVLLNSLSFPAAHNLAKTFGMTKPTIIRVSPSGVKVEEYVVPHTFENK